MTFGEILPYLMGGKHIRRRNWAENNYIKYVDHKILNGCLTNVLMIDYLIENNWVYLNRKELSKVDEGCKFKIPGIETEFIKCVLGACDTKNLYRYNNEIFFGDINLMVEVWEG